MPSYNSDIGISIPTEANRSAPLTAAYYLGEPLRAGSPMQLGVTLVGSDQQDFLNLSICRYAGVSPDGRGVRYSATIFR